MEKILIVGDIHLDDRHIEEIDNIFSNDILTINADTIIQLGDFFHSAYPSPRELKYASELVKKLSTLYKKVVILSGTGEHDLVKGHSVVEHFSAISSKIVISKGDYIYNKMLFGHFMVNESKLAFGTGRYSLKQLTDKYTYTFLGHQHIPQRLANDRVFHLGAIRYVSFSEADSPRHLFLLEGENAITHIPIKHCRRMVEVTSFEGLEQADFRDKVRFVVPSFEFYKTNINRLNECIHKYFEFKIKMDFEVKEPITIENAKIHKNDIITDYIKNIPDQEVKTILEDKFYERN